MNTHAMAVAAYGNPTKAHKTARDAEYEVVARITARLREAHLGGAFSFPALAEALTENRRLWTEFASDLSSDNNQLPDELKAQILYLARFTLTQTEAILNGRGSAETLIEINTAILRGLAGREHAS